MFSCEHILFLFFSPHISFNLKLSYFQNEKKKKKRIPDSDPSLHELCEKNTKGNRGPPLCPCSFSDPFPMS